MGEFSHPTADYFQAVKAPGHGDLHILVFAPSTVQEMVDCVFQAYDLAETYRMPAMILGDGLLGQMMEPLTFPETAAKPLEKPWAVNGNRNVREKNVVNSLYLLAEELEQKILERYERYHIIEQREALHEQYLTDDADIVLVAYGASSRIVRSAVNSARAAGIKAGMLRPITLWPFPKQAFLSLHLHIADILVVEMSMGQMVEDVRLAVNGRIPVHFYGRTGGVIPTPAAVLEEIVRIAGGVLA